MEGLELEKQLKKQGKVNAELRKKITEFAPEIEKS